MSHIVHIQTKIRDAEALRAACRRLELPPPVAGTARLFNAEASGQLVTLPGWRFPVVCTLETGNLAYDNFGGRWGDSANLGRLLQMYAVEKARLEARREGHTVSEQSLADGSIKLVITVGSAS